MGKIILLLFSVFLIAILVVGMFYFIKFNKKENVVVNNNTREIYVSAKDFDTKEQIETEFTILDVNNTIIAVGNTQKSGYEKLEIPSDINALQFLNTPNDYYRNKLLIVGFPTLIEMELNKKGNMVINHLGNLNNTQGSIKYFIETNSENREISFCVSWTNAIIDVISDDFISILNNNEEASCVNNGYNWINEEIECGFWCSIGLTESKITPSHCSEEISSTLPPSFLIDRIDKCYYSKKTINKNNPFVFTLNYKSFDTLNEGDNIILYVIDSDRDLNNNYKYENEKGEDIGVPVIKYTVFGEKVI